MTKRILVFDSESVSHQDLLQSLQLLFKTDKPTFDMVSTLEDFTAMLSQSLTWDFILINFQVDYFWRLDKTEMEEFINSVKRHRSPTCILTGITGDEYQKHQLERFGLKVIYKVYDRAQLKDLLGVGDKPITLEEIEKIVCDYFNVEAEQLHLKTRKREIVQARQVTMYLGKLFITTSLKNIGTFFGGRDHTTVIHSCQTVKDLIDTEPKFRFAVTELREKILFRC